MAKRTLTCLIVEAEVRYWEDTEVNGVEDSDGTLIPFRRGALWCPVIDLETGKLLNWPAGTTAKIHYKVCDQGAYWLGGPDGRKTLKWKGYYVPDDLLCVGDRGYGDYIIMNIAADGSITGWQPPAIAKADWNEVDDA